MVWLGPHPLATGPGGRGSNPPFHGVTLIPRGMFGYTFQRYSGAKFQPLRNPLDLVIPFKGIVEQNFNL